MSDKAEILEKVITAHKGVDRGLELATALGLNPSEYASSKLLQMNIIKASSWNNQRSPHGLMVDCIYLCAKRKGIKTSALKVYMLTKHIFDVGTQPRPSEWKKPFSHLIEEWL